jgi:hypothetical protein
MLLLAHRYYPARRRHWQYAIPIRVNDLAQLIKDSPVAFIDVAMLNTASAAIRDQETFAIRLDQPGGFPQLLQSLA